jgi:uncharacterized membrane protein
MEPAAITAIIISVLAAAGTLLARLRFRHCHMLCCDSDCIRTPMNTPPPTPRTTEQDVFSISDVV